MIPLRADQSAAGRICNGPVSENSFTAPDGFADNPTKCFVDVGSKGMALQQIVGAQRVTAR
jgi:hypothetical protein